MTVRRRHFLLATAALALTPVLRAQTVKPLKTAGTARIYMVTWRGETAVEKGFCDYWKTRHPDVEFIVRDAGQNRARLVEFGAEIVREKPDLVYAWGTPPTVGLGGTFDNPHAVIGKTIPLVFAAVTDPIGAKIVASLGSPGRNLTGVTHVAPLEAQLKAMRAYGGVKGVAVMYNKLESNSLGIVDEWRRIGLRDNIVVAADSFALNAEGKPTPDMLEEKLARLKTAGADWLYLPPDSYVSTQGDAIARIATGLGLKSFASVETLLNVKGPVLMGLVSKFYQVGQFAASKAEQKLSGVASVPVETLKRFSLIVRMDTAKALGAMPPLGLVEYAEFQT